MDSQLLINGHVHVHTRRVTMALLISKFDSIVILGKNTAAIMETTFLSQYSFRLFLHYIMYQQ